MVLTKFLQRWTKSFLGLLSLLTVPIYLRGFYKNTLQPITAIVESNTENEIKATLTKWLQLKTREAQYLSVAVRKILVPCVAPLEMFTRPFAQGAVIFASITQCLSWPSLATSHWSATALFYSCILLSIPSILLGTQQLSVLPEIEDIQSMPADEIYRMRESFLSSTSTLSSASSSPEVSTFVLFVWQAPRMFFAASLACFIGGLISIVISPVALKPGWNADVKVPYIIGIIISTRSNEFADCFDIWFRRRIHAIRFHYRYIWRE
jgi:hypothetical protein